MLGPNRILAACLLPGPVPLGSFAVRQFCETDSVMAVATTIDMVWAVVIAFVLPSAFALAMMVAVAMLAVAANEDTNTLFATAGVGGLGFMMAGLVRDIDAWIPMVVVYVLILPLIFFLAATQRERELRHQLRFRHRVDHDSLTGLRNRARLASACPVNAVIAIDLDGFKDINDTLGHKAGDELLVALASRMDAAVGANGVLARTGGDEFTVLIFAADANTIAADILRACRHRIPLGDVEPPGLIRRATSRCARRSALRWVSSAGRAKRAQHHGGGYRSPEMSSGALKTESSSSSSNQSWTWPRTNWSMWRGSFGGVTPNTAC